jgi:hypothetical protein
MSYEGTLYWPSTVYRTAMLSLITILNRTGKPGAKSVVMVMTN